MPSTPAKRAKPQHVDFGFWVAQAKPSMPWVSRRRRRRHAAVDDHSPREENISSASQAAAADVDTATVSTAAERNRVLPTDKRAESAANLTISRKFVDNQLNQPRTNIFAI